MVTFRAFHFISIFVELVIEYIKNHKKFCSSLPEGIPLCQTYLKAMPSYQLAEDKSLTGPDWINKLCHKIKLLMVYLKDYLVFASCYLLTEVKTNISVRNTVILKHRMKYFRLVAMHREEMYFKMREGQFQHLQENSFDFFCFSFL